jgi:hypothetical protein
MQARCWLPCHLVVLVLERGMLDIVIADNMGAYVEHAEYVSKREGDRGRAVLWTVLGWRQGGWDKETGQHSKHIGMCGDACVHPRKRQVCQAQTSQATKPHCRAVGK